MSQGGTHHDALTARLGFSVGTKYNKTSVIGADGAAATPVTMMVAKGTLAAGNANAFAFAWQNPHAVKILVHRVLVQTTTAGGTGTSVLDVGSAANATTGSDNLIDGADLNATALYDNIDNQGTDGKAKQVVDEKGGTTDYVTGRILVANAASLAGKYYIFYTAV